LNNITENIAPSLSHYNVPIQTEQILDSKENQTEIDMQQEQVGSPTSVVDSTINDAKEE
jgi:hypothetical protein